MKKVYQTKFRATDGNCFAACLSTLTGIPLELFDGCYKQDVYAFYLEHNKVLNQHGFHYVCFDAKKIADTVYSTPPGLMIMTGTPTARKRDSVGHAVIGIFSTEQDGSFCGLINLWHDPWPSGLGLQEVDCLGFVINIYQHEGWHSS